MAYTTINKSTDYFNTKLYTGTGSSNALTGVGHNPDFVWIKSRADSYSHFLFDAVRGVYKRIKTNSTDAETESNESLKSFDSDGFTLGTQANINNSGSTYASWNWKAGTGQGSSNTDGSINTTYTSVNTTAGFSISSYTGTGSSATIGHGLATPPKFTIIKKTSGTGDWSVQSSVIGLSNYLVLNSTNASAGTSGALISAVSSTTLTVDGNSDVNGSGSTYIAYCFAEKTGYSKFGSYTGNGNADGTFIYTGFKPAWVMIKRTDDVASWTILDNKRDSFNVTEKRLFPDDASAEVVSANGNTDFLSNGVKIRTSHIGINLSGATYIYMAFAEAPLVGTNNVPCTAR
jgi:hypothetical protein